VLADTVPVRAHRRSRSFDIDIRTMNLIDVCSALPQRTLIRTPHRAMTRFLETIAGQSRSWSTHVIVVITRSW
jgi:hypothetical protein